MSKQNDQSVQAKNSNQAEKFNVALQILGEFIESFKDPNPKTNQEILSELLTVGFRERPCQDDPDYSKLASRLSEAVRELLNGIIDLTLDDQIMFQGLGQSGSGSLKYDYSKLDKFLSIEKNPLELAKGFTRQQGCFSELMARVIVEARCHGIFFDLPGYHEGVFSDLIEMFEIIRELEEVKS